MLTKRKLEIGTWVTQYSAGFWQIVDIVPQYADEDYKNKTTNWKKGDLIGYWALLKKGFTPKMKFKIEFECVNAYWCKEVSKEQKDAIQSFFEANPEKKIRFDHTPWKDKLAVNALWLTLENDTKFEYVSECLKKLPSKFTLDYFSNYIKEIGIHHCFIKGPSFEEKDKQMYIIYLYTNLYEVDDNRNLLYQNPQIIMYSD